VVVTQACKGLSKAHALGIVHRDIKPDNIFISNEDGDPFVRLLDFGVAKESVGTGLDFTASGTMMGTPYYMSPEQAISSKQVDLRSDIWSLAVVAYHALTGRRPFDGETLGALCLNLNAGLYQPASQLRPDLPSVLDDWFARAMAREPAARFGSAKEMADGFSDATDATGPRLTPAVSVPVQPPVGRSRADSVGTLATTLAMLRRKRPSLLRVAVSAAAVAVVVGVAGWWLLRARRADTSAAATAIDETRQELPAAVSAVGTTVDDVPAPEVAPVTSTNESSTRVPVRVEPSGREAAASPKDGSSAKSAVLAPAPKPAVARGLPNGGAAAPVPSQRPAKKDHGF
jgi:hypothetical protein